MPKKNAVTVKIKLKNSIPDKIFPEIPPVKLKRKDFSAIKPHPISVGRSRMRDKMSKSIKKDCLKISNL